MSLKIAIQGVRASFHEVAAQKFFRDEPLNPIECATFKELCNQLQTKNADFAVMAIENSIAGSILPNYSLLESYQFTIIGEVYLRIELALLALKGQKVKDLQFVQSHPMALHQCQEFLDSNKNLKILETHDTAESAKNISENQLKGHAAIASRLAGDTYGLEVLESGIETNKQNYTRFLVISKDRGQASKLADKASFRFQIKHQPGSLVDVLKIFNDHGINMTKIQSVPILGKPYEYGFHVDVEWTKLDDYRKALEKIKTNVINLIHFGEYPRGERPVK